jgi:hypothetical protein
MNEALWWDSSKHATPNLAFAAWRLVLASTAVVGTCNKAILIGGVIQQLVSCLTCNSAVAVR